MFFWKKLSLPINLLVTVSKKLHLRRPFEGGDGARSSIRESTFHGKDVISTYLGDDSALRLDAGGHLGGQLGLRTRSGGRLVGAS